MPGPKGNVACRVYVHNLPYSFQWQDLKDNFAEAGTVVRADVMMTASRRSKGCGLVEFATPEEAKNAIRIMNDKEIEGRKILVREDREKSKPAAEGAAAAPAPRNNKTGTFIKTAQNNDVHGRQVFVNNLDKSITWKELKDAFSPAGNVVRADIIADENNEFSRGQGLILFETKEAAQKAIEDFHEGELKDKIIQVKMDTKVGQYGRIPAGNTNTTQQKPRRQHNNSDTPAGPTTQQKPRRQHNNSDTPAGPTRRVYVHNLSYSVTWQDLKDHFRPQGEIVFADVMRNPRGQSKGCGIVEFKTEEEAAAAIVALNESEFQGRNILVREDREARRSAPQDKVEA